MRSSIVSIGEMLCQFCKRPGASMQSIGYGGDSLAVVVTISHIANKYALGIHTQYYTALGPNGDPASDTALDFVTDQGVGVDMIQRISGRTLGTFVINYNDYGEVIPDPDTGERFTFVRKESAATQMVSPSVNQQVIESFTTDFDYVYLSLISLAVLCHRPGTRGAGVKDQDRLIEILAQARRNGKVTALNTNLRSGLWGFSKGAELSHPQKREALRVLNKALEQSNIVIASIADEQELEFFDGDTPQYEHSKRIHSYGVKKVAITDGHRDIFVSWLEDGALKQEWVRIFPVKEEERGNEAGLGDAFAGGFLLGDMIGKSPPESARIGAFMGATALKCLGEIISQENLSDMEDLL